MSTKARTGAESWPRTKTRPRPPQVWAPTGMTRRAWPRRGLQDEDAASSLGRDWDEDETLALARRLQEEEDTSSAARRKAQDELDKAVLQQVTTKDRRAQERRLKQLAGQNRRPWSRALSSSGKPRSSKPRTPDSLPLRAASSPLSRRRRGNGVSGGLLCLGSSAVAAPASASGAGLRHSAALTSSKRASGTPTGNAPHIGSRARWPACTRARR